MQFISLAVRRCVKGADWRNGGLKGCNQLQRHGYKKQQVA